MTRRVATGSVDFGSDMDLLYLAVIGGGMVALAVPELSIVFLFAVAAWWIVNHTAGVSPPADDRQDLHDR